MNDREIFKGHLIRVVLQDIILPNGVQMTVEVVRHPGAAAAVPIDEAGNVILINQFRPVVGKYLLELPAGKVEESEDPRQAVERELLEETGMRAQRIDPLVTILSAPGYSDEQVAIFLARRLSPSSPRADTQEVLTVARVPLSEAVKLVESGEISDSKTAIGLLLAANYLHRETITPNGSSRA